MITPIPFDPHRFQTAARHYHARQAYAPRLFQRLAAETGLRPDDRVMDLGCGPGVVAVALAPYAGAIVGVDPEPEMLATAAKATAAFADKITLVQGSSNDLGAVPGTFAMVAMGRSFHWMDRVETLRRLDTIIGPRGSVVLISSGPLDERRGWQKDYRDIIAKYSADGGGPGWRGPDWVENEDVLLRSAFSQLDRIGVIEQGELPADALIDRAFSLSRTAPNVLGPEKSAALTADLRALLARVAPDGVLMEAVESKALIARRP
ncbi:MAG: class I SAM-dependent methyltransferase [Bauldia sp.]